MFYCFNSMIDDYGLDMNALKASLSPKFNRDMVFRAGEGAGASGSFFFFSHDNKFLIKTMTDTEMTLMMRLLPKF